MRQLRKVASTDDFLSFNLPQGLWRSFSLQYKGTAVGGQTVLITDLGKVRLIINNKQFQNINIDRLLFYNGLKEGAVTSVSAAGAAYDFQLELPQHAPNDSKNCLFLEADGEGVLELEGFSSAAKIATGTVTVYGNEVSGIQQYFFKIDMQDFTATSGSHTEDVKGIENIFALYLENDTTNLDRVLITSDNVNKTLANADRDSLVNRTNLVNEIETYSASLAFLEVLFAESRQLSESLMDSALVQTEMSAGAGLDMFITSIDFTPDKEAASAALLSARIGQRLEVKTQQGKTRAARVIA